MKPRNLNNLDGSNKQKKKRKKKMQNDKGILTKPEAQNKFKEKKKIPGMDLPFG